MPFLTGELFRLAGLVCRVFLAFPCLGPGLFLSLGALGGGDAPLLTGELLFPRQGGGLLDDLR